MALKADVQGKQVTDKKKLTIRQLGALPGLVDVNVGQGANDRQLRNVFDYLDLWHTLGDH
jgi:hypothetical protein